MWSFKRFEKESLFLTTKWQTKMLTRNSLHRVGGTIKKENRAPKVNRLRRPQMVKRLQRKSNQGWQVRKYY